VKESSAFVVRAVKRASHTIEADNAVMPLDVLGRTRATLMKSPSFWLAVDLFAADFLVRKDRVIF
jgi:hypothetical protein